MCKEFGRIILVRLRSSFSPGRSNGAPLRLASERTRVRVSYCLSTPAWNNAIRECGARLNRWAELLARSVRSA